MLGLTCESYRGHNGDLVGNAGGRCLCLNSTGFLNLKRYVASHSNDNWTEEGGRFVVAVAKQFVLHLWFEREMLSIWRFGLVLERVAQPGKFAGKSYFWTWVRCLNRRFREWSCLRGFCYVYDQDVEGLS